MEFECHGTAKEIYEKLKNGFEKYRSQGKLSQIQKIQFQDDVCLVCAEGTGFKSKIQCLENKIFINFDLNFLLKPMRSQIEESVRKFLNKVFTN